jgi:YesN/AraC family two-component response regulator
MARILVVDDDEIVRSAIRQALEFYGHVVEDSADGDDAIECIRERGADLVITDIVMPNMAGIDTIMEIRALDEATRILAISGGGCFTSDGYLRSAVVLGADQSLDKPFTVNQLVDAVDDLLGLPRRAKLDAELA